jgi:hypothetical protein
MATVEQIYGKAAAMRMRTEKAVLEQYSVCTSLVVFFFFFFSLVSISSNRRTNTCDSVFLVYQALVLDWRLLWE